jgi:hypothetical protein
LNRSCCRAARQVGPPAELLQAESSGDFKVGSQARDPRRISHRHRATPTCDVGIIAGPCEEMMSEQWVFREVAATAASSWPDDEKNPPPTESGRGRGEVSIQDDRRRWAAG